MQELLKNSDARPLSLFSLSIFGPHPIGGDGKRGFAAGGFAAAQMLFIPFSVGEPQHSEYPQV
jgi:hypothetical protein